MKKLIGIIILLAFAFTSRSQGLDTMVYTATGTVPQFPGGPEALFKYVSENIIYPAKARDNHTEGKVFVSFVIEKDGSISKAKVIHTASADLNDEALRLINASPKWIPATNNNQPVRASYIVPITFSLSAPVDTAKKTAVRFLHVEMGPQYPGGLDALVKFLDKNIHKGSDEGRVTVTFVVDRDGSLTDIAVIKSLSEKADAEALRVIGIMPKWKPGMQDGHPVRVKYTIPIKF